jgi:hypothetical protein
MICGDFQRDKSSSTCAGNDDHVESSHSKIISEVTDRILIAERRKTIRSYKSYIARALMKEGLQAKPQDIDLVLAEISARRKLPASPPTHQHEPGLLEEAQRLGIKQPERMAEAVLISHIRGSRPDESIEQENAQDGNY